jgi:hypothetical protein
VCNLGIFQKSNILSVISELRMVKCWSFGGVGSTGNAGCISCRLENILFYEFNVLSTLFVQDEAYTRAFKRIFAFGPETSWMGTESDALGRNRN